MSGEGSAGQNVDECVEKRIMKLIWGRFKRGKGVSKRIKTGGGEASGGEGAGTWSLQRYKGIARIMFQSEVKIVPNDIIWKRETCKEPE